MAALYERAWRAVLRQLHGRVPRALTWTREWPKRHPVSPGPLDKKTTVLLVYRHRNADIVLSLLGDGGQADVRLWALDQSHPSLAPWTLGVGPGPKFGLLNRLLASAPLNDGSWVVVSDDDLCFVRHGLGAAVDLARRGELDLCQPAHSAVSFFNWGITLARPLTKATLSDFVEVGPLVIFAPRHRDEFLPFPDDAGMGWGLEVEWRKAKEVGARLAILDGAPIVHLAPARALYDGDAEQLHLDRRVRSIGATSITDIMRRGERWQRWQRRAPWL